MAKAKLITECLITFEHKTKEFLEASEQTSRSLSVIREVISNIRIEKSFFNSIIEEINETISMLDQTINQLNNTRVDLNSKILKINSKISKLKYEIDDLSFRLSKTSPTIIINGVLLSNPEYLAIKSELAVKKARLMELESKYIRCQNILSNVCMLLTQSKNKKDELNKIRILSERTVCDLFDNEKKLSEILSEIENNSIFCIKNSRIALERLAKAKKELLVYESIKLNIYSPRMRHIDYRKNKNTNGLDFIDESIIRSTPANSKNNFNTIIAASKQYLNSYGINLDELSKASGNLKKFEVIKKTVSDINIAKQLLSVTNLKFLPDKNGGFAPFYETSPQTAGDSAEWFILFENLANGYKSEKEVHFDLTPFQGKKMTFLGYDEIISRPFRATDIVKTSSDGKDIHQEIKVGLWGSNLRSRIRDELYADSIRLDTNLKTEQEYRIYRNAINGKCLFDDKEQAGYLLKMKEKYPTRVRVYYENDELTINDLKLKIKGDDR